MQARRMCRSVSRVGVCCTYSKRGSIFSHLFFSALMVEPSPLIGWAHRANEMARYSSLLQSTNGRTCALTLGVGVYIWCVRDLPQL